MRALVLALGLVVLLGTAAWAETTVEYPVVVSADDAMAISSSGGHTMTEGYWPYSSDERRTFMRWQMTVPPGATITAAYLKVRALDAASWPPNTASTVRLQVVDSDDCPDFTTNPFASDVTATYVDWTVPAGWTGGQWYTSSDVSSLVQAFIDRAGYEFGNFLGLRAMFGSGPWKRIVMYDYGDHSGAPVLEVHYTGGAALLELLMADPEVRIGQKIYCRTFNVNATDTLEARLDGNVIYTKTGNVGLEEMFTADYSQLTAGQHTLLVRVLDTSSTVRGSVTRTWTTLHNGIPHVGINVHNAICVDGTPFLPILATHLDVDRFSDPIGTTNNAVLHTGYYLTYNLANWEDYLDECDEEGWWVAGPSLWAGKVPEDLASSDFNSVAQYVTTTRSHEALLSWFWTDEPDLHDDNAPGTRQLTDVTHANDTNHPVWVNLVGYDFTHGGSTWFTDHVKEYCYLYNEDVFGEKTMIADIIGMDYYPHEYSTYYDFCNISDYMLALDRTREWNYDLAPLAAYVQPCDERAYGTPGLGGRPWTPGPNEAQVKNLVWLNLIHGVKALSYFHFFSWFTTDPRPNLAALQEAKEWIEDLTQVILSPEEEVTTDVSVTVPTGYRVDFMTRLDDEEALYIFSGEVRDWGDPPVIWPDPEDWTTAYFNIPQGSFTARFDVDGMADNTVITVYGEDRTIISEDGYFEDTFDVHDVHIYVIGGEAENMAPTADAGEDQTVTDNDDSGYETVALDGTGSSDGDGTIVTYVWTEGANQIATGSTASVSFAVGTHTVTLTVTDDLGATDSDTVTIAVNEAPDQYTVQYQIAASRDDTFAIASWNAYDQQTLYLPYSSTDRRAFFRWPINIPAGATIISATLSVKSNGSSGSASTPSTIRLQLIDSDNCSQFTTNPFAWTVSTSYVDWTTPGHWVAGDWYASSDIAALVQEFIDRAGYSQGNALGLRGIWTAGPWRQAYQYDSSADNGATLSITYSPDD
ncbi:MAG: PKD domain-containing protein [Phycisphaerae bacterium]|nr:PKD domain-containing protein [Phycisphaerae bacterium]